MTKKEPVVQEYAMEELVIEGAGIPKKKLLEFVNDYSVLHKTRLDTIKFNMEVNKKFNELVMHYENMLEDLEIEMIEN